MWYNSDPDYKSKQSDNWMVGNNINDSPYPSLAGVTLENNKTISLLSSYPTPGREQTVAGYKTMSALHLGSNNSNVSYLVSRAWRESQPSVLRIWWLVSSSAPGLLNKLTIFRSQTHRLQSTVRQGHLVKAQV